MKKNNFVTIRVDDKNKKLLKQDANKEGRSISNFLLWCWEQWRKRKERK